MYAEVALIQGNFTYQLSNEFSWVSPGIPVLVPVKNKLTMGFISSLQEETTLERVRPVKEVLSDETILVRNQLALSREMADYYASTQGLCIKHMLPPWVRERLRHGKPLYYDRGRKPPPREAKMRLIPELKNAISSEKFKTFLLFGEDRLNTYLAAIEYTIAGGRSVILLRPEMIGKNLTVESIKERFGDEVALTHSKLKEKERGLIWEGTRRKGYSVCVGSISAVFAPFPDLGLIIVDEEHSDSYKMGQRPWHNVRDVAVMRSRIENITCILGSCTPSFESFHNAKVGKYSLIESVRKLVAVSTSVVDARKEEFPFLSSSLLSKIKERIKNREKVILFLPKKGYSKFCMCLDCGWIPYCPQCSVTLDYYRGEHKLVCHYCGYEMPAPGRCDRCKGTRFTYPGEGTERLESTVKKIFKEAKLVRMDADVLKTPLQYETAYNKFAEEGDILLGTQLVIKSSQPDSVTLIGMVSCDSQLSFPDFRTAEKFFSQVVRAKEMIKKGEIVLQTYNPGNSIFRYIRDNDYRTFYSKEIESRKTFGLPPFSHLVRLLSQSKDRKRAEVLVERIAEDLDRKGYDIFGISPCPIERKRGRWRFHILVKVQNPMVFFRNVSLPKSVSAEVDPQDMM